MSIETQIEATKDRIADLRNILADSTSALHANAMQLDIMKAKRDSLDVTRGGFNTDAKLAVAISKLRVTRHEIRESMTVTAQAIKKASRELEMLITWELRRG